MVRPMPMVLSFYLLLTSQLAGCASQSASYWKEPTRGTLFTSEPTGARVMIDGGHFGQTPIVVKLTREANYAVTFHADGYADRTYGFQLHDKKVHGILSPLRSAAASDSAARGHAVSDSASLGIGANNRAWGSVTTAAPPRPPQEADRLLIHEGAPLTIALHDGTILPANLVEQASFDFVKATLTSGKTVYLSKSKIRSIASRGGSDWTTAVLDEGKRVPPR